MLWNRFYLYKEYLRRARLMFGLDHAIFLINIKQFLACDMHRPWYIKYHALWMFCHTCMSHENKILFLVFITDVQKYIAYALNKVVLQKTKRKYILMVIYHFYILKKCWKLLAEVTFFYKWEVRFHLPQCLKRLLRYKKKKTWTKKTKW